MQARREPKPIQKPYPPFVIGGAGEQLTLRVVARYADVWNSMPSNVVEFRHKVRVLHEHCAEMVRAGKARYIGASAMYAWQFAKALYTAELHGWTRFVSMQPHYNLIYREEEREMLPLCLDQQIAVIPYSPVAKGLLTRKPSKDQTETLRAQTDAIQRRLYNAEDLAIAQRISDVAEVRGLPMAQVALAWMLSKPVVTAPIIGTTKPHHLDDAVAAVAVQLSPDEIHQLEETYQPHPVLGYS